MGGDGGQVIDRGTMVKTRGWGFTKSSGDRYANSLGEMANYVQMVSEDRGLGPLERRRVRMSQCLLSQEPLLEPVVACRLGNLYNKEAVISALLNKSMPAGCSHIRALKDVKQCLLTWKLAEGEGGRRRMVCPVTRQDLDDGSARAVLVWPSGAVVSAKAQKEMKMSECPVTGRAFEPERDLIPLAPEREELEALQARLPAAKKRKALAASSKETTAPAPDAAASSEVSGAVPELSSEAGSGAAAAHRVKEEEAPEQEARSKAPRGEAAAKSEVFKSLFIKDRGDGLTGCRDPLGTPAYNRGSRIC